MHEDEFRARFHAALGEAPDQAGAVRRAVAAARSAPLAPERPSHPQAMALVAAGLALLVLGGLLAPRLLRSLQRATAPAASPAPAATAVAAADCRLPVIVKDFRSGQETDTTGFVTVATGEFEPAPAGLTGLPYESLHDRELVPESYDAALGRWLPANRAQTSPDQRSYAYVQITGDTGELHVYDVVGRQDRKLWSAEGHVFAYWLVDGIHVDVTPPGGGQPRAYVIDPASGEATETRWLPLLDKGDGITHGEGASGPLDSQDTEVLSDGSRAPGALIEYFLPEPNYQRIVIHSGTMGDADDFDPSGFAADGDRLWAVNYDGTALWLWTRQDGLRRFPLSGVPQHDMYATTFVAGPCA
jgi:hypothetical protein